MTVLAVVRAVLLALCAGSVVYGLFAVLAARDFFSSRLAARDAPPLPISILKPVCGAEADAAEIFRSFCRQDYPEFQLLFGALDAGDPGLAAARTVAAEFPERDIEIVSGGTPSGGNPKVDTLARLEPRARHDLLLISDSDVRVSGDYLRSVTAPLADPRVGVVTSPYRSRGRGLGGILQALGNATEFQPSVFVARKLEGLRFALGAGIVIRRGVLREIGGFPAVAEYLADDLMLGLLPARAGHRIVLALPVVDHELGRVSLRDFARRQIRWNRGIRAARPWGYVGFLGTQATVAAISFLAAAKGSAFGWAVAAAVIAVRAGMAWEIGAVRLGDPTVRRWIALLPLRDLAGFLLWLAGFFGGTVRWRGRRYRLAAGGKIAGEDPS